MNFRDLAEVQVEDIDYRVHVCPNEASSIAVIAPHGGGIEQYTSDIARAIAGADFNLYRYTQFCQLYKDWAKTLKRSMRQQHRAGEKLFADFAGHTVSIAASNGDVAFQAHVFVAVLGASNYTFACATRSETMVDWISSLIDAMAFFGGVPELLVPDNPRALIAQPDRYEPVLGRTTQDFVNHYGTAMLPARPRKPQDEPKVEVGVQIVERWILARLRNHRFFSLMELNKAIDILIVDLNRRPFKKLDGNRLASFERLDQPVLRKDRQAMSKVNGMLLWAIFIVLMTCAGWYGPVDALQVWAGINTARQVPW